MRFFFHILFPLVTACFFSACHSSGNGESIQSEVSEDSLRAYVKTLASDEFEGRMPFTKGEEKTVGYLVGKMKKFGLRPGNGDSYVQEVPLVDIQSEAAPVAEISTPRGSLKWNRGQDFVAYTEQEKEEILLDNSEFIFCGYGITAPEYGWDDFSGIDPKGKTIIVLVNDPGLYSGDSTFFKGNTMTYYGRWTYKYEEAARQGAAGVLIVHDTEMAGYPWTVVRNSWTGSEQGLQSENKGADKSLVQGWITTEAAEELFSRAGEDFSELKEAAARPGFAPVPLGASWSVHLRSKLTYNQSQNVIAVIPGKGENPESIIFSAHWDHFGIATPVDGDSIYNGAIDNATGVAALIEIARTYREEDFRPERNLIFLFVTAEEQGLLGSEYYTTNPVFPIETTVANLNIDAMSAFGPMKDVTMIGYGHSTFDEILQEAALAQNRYIIPDQEPEKGYFFRSDHFNFAKAGIPALYASGKFEHQEKGSEYAREKSEEYLDRIYHQPADEYREDMDFGGIREDTQLYYEIGRKLGKGKITPEWKPESEFSR